MKHPYMESAQRLDLFHLEEHSPGFVWWHPNGQRLLRSLRSLLRDAHEEAGYQEVKTPNLSGRELFEQSGHLSKFSHNMFLAHGAERELVVRPMSCPAHIRVFDSAPRSHAQLPLKYFEFGEVVRNEPSGSLQALFRMRGFTQDDSHVFAAQSQVVQVVAQYLAMSQAVYQKLGFTEVSYRISLRPAERFGEEALWDKAESMLRDACRQEGLSWEEEPGGGAFYGPKLEMHLKDHLGRSWQMGVIQLDFVLPQRFGLKFLNESNEMEVPVILHHAVLGSLERFVGVLLEQYGTQLPARLQPLQLAVVAVREPHEAFAQDFAHKFKKLGIRAQVWGGDGRLNDKVKQAEMSHPSWIVVIGDKEIEYAIVTVRRQGKLHSMPQAEFMAEVLAAVSA